MGFYLTPHNAMTDTVVMPSVTTLIKLNWRAYGSHFTISGHMTNAANYPKNFRIKNAATTINGRFTDYGALGLGSPGS